MPCRDYESDNWDYSSENRQLKEQADKLARIACKAMSALEENGIEDFLILKDNEVAEWWAQHKEADRKEKARIVEKERRERVKAEALAKLSSEERELLGLAPKVKSRSRKAKNGTPVPVQTAIMDIESDMYSQLAYDLTDFLKEINNNRYDK
jgi:uncharacterized protein YcaQ